MLNLIDGYNLMHAGGLLSKGLGPERFRQARTRFLNVLADRLGPIAASVTTVVFDASNPPFGLPAQSTHKGLTILYSVNEENADAHIERLIAAHSHPKNLNVISSDRRVRQAATRRRAKSIGAEEFWVELDRLKESARKSRKPQERPLIPPMPNPKPKGGRDPRLNDGEAAFWADAFRDVETMPELQDPLANPRPMLSDADIARIEKEIDDEFGSSERR